MHNAKTISRFFILNSDVDAATVKLKKLAKFKISYHIVSNTEAKSKGYTQIQAEVPEFIYFETGRPISSDFTFCEKKPFGIAIVTADNKYLFRYHH